MMLGRNKKDAVGAFLKGYSRASTERGEPSAGRKDQKLLFDRSEIRSQPQTQLSSDVIIGGVFHVDAELEKSASIAVTAGAQQTDVIVTSLERQLITLSLLLPKIEGPEPAIGICLAGTASARTVVTPALRANSEARQIAMSKMRGCMFDVKPWTFAEAATLNRSNNQAADLYICISFQAKELTLSFTDFRIW